MKKLGFLLVFLVAGVSSMLAQTTHDFDIQSTAGSYTSKGAIVVSNSNVTAVDGANVTAGTVSFQTGPTGNNGSFSGGSLTYSSVPNVGSATATNLAGTLVQLYSLPSGTGTIIQCQLAMTFSGVDSTGASFSGTSIHLVTMNLSSRGQVVSVQDDAGNTTITYN